MPLAAMLTVNEAELSRDTHDVIKAFNGALNFLDAADTSAPIPPTTRIPNGRIWGTVADERPPGLAEALHDVARSGHARDVHLPVRGRADRRRRRVWILFINGSFLATGGGARKGMGTFHMEADGLRNGGFPIGPDHDGEMLKDLTVKYSTAGFPISVAMKSAVPKADSSRTCLRSGTTTRPADRAGAMEFSGAADCDGAPLTVQSRWLATGRGRADARRRRRPW